MLIHFVSRGPLETISGGYLYNRYLMEQLASAGHRVVYHAEADEPGPLARSDAVVVDGIAIDELDPRLLEAARVKVLLLHCVPGGLRPGSPRTRRVAELCRQCRVVVTGEETRARLAQALAMTDLDAVTIEPGIADSWRTKESYADTAGRLLCIANYIEGKGIVRGLRILKSLERLPWSLSVYGNADLDAGYYAHIRDLVQTLQFTARVHLFESVDHKAINDVMLQSDLLLQLSRDESYSMATAEAIAAGLPVLSTRTGNWRQFAQSGLVVHVDDDGEAETHLRSLILDRAAYGRLRSNAHTPRRTWQDVGREFLSLLEATC